MSDDEDFSSACAERSSSTAITVVRSDCFSPNDEEFARMLDVLSAVERERVCKFRRPTRDGQWLTGAANNDAKQSLIGRLLIRRAVALRSVEVSKPSLERRFQSAHECVYGGEKISI